MSDHEIEDAANRASMSSTDSVGQSPQARSARIPKAFSSNAVRLSGRQWLVAGLVTLVVLFGTPWAWQRAEDFAPGADYRVPYELSNDYWLYERLVDKTMTGNRLLVIGDSVIWGEYVLADQTLTHYLNVQLAQTRFVNGGLNGVHPLALDGLIRWHAAGVRNTRVLLHANLLWTCNKERDLQCDAETPFNHPGLVPQWLWRIPSYRAPFSDRLSASLDRALPFRTWAAHLRISGWGNLGLAEWSLEHPYENPFAPSRLLAPPPPDRLRHRPIPWQRAGIKPQDFPWVDPATSLQNRAFRVSVRLLQERGNRLFVMLGPFNEHMLTVDSRQRYRARKQVILGWLAEMNVPCLAPDPLPSEEYADASHPLSAGYERLARQLMADETFRGWLAYKE